MIVIVTVIVGLLAGLFLMILYSLAKLSLTKRRATLEENVLVSILSALLIVGLLYWLAQDSMRSDSLELVIYIMMGSTVFPSFLWGTMLGSVIQQSAFKDLSDWTAPPKLLGAIFIPTLIFMFSLILAAIWWFTHGHYTMFELVSMGGAVTISLCGHAVALACSSILVDRWLKPRKATISRKLINDR